MKRIAIVGGAGLVGRALERELTQRETADKTAERCEVVVVDKARASGAGHRPIDIVEVGAKYALADAFAGCDAVVHLAALVDPQKPREREAARKLHVDGTRAVIRGALKARVKHFVLASSAVVYGARADNPVPLDESAPVRPNEDFAYAVDKAAQEEVLLDELLDEDRELSAVIARPAIVYGPGARSYLTEILRRAPFLPALDGRRPFLQFVHVDDVARALAHLALDRDSGVLRGVVEVFNVAPADWLAYEEVARLCEKRVVDVPRALVAPVVEGLSRVLPPYLRAPAAMLPYLMHPFVLSSAKLAKAGCAPRLTSTDALRAMLRT